MGHTRRSSVFGGPLSLKRSSQKQVEPHPAAEKQKRLSTFSARAEASSATAVLRHSGPFKKA